MRIYLDNCCYNRPFDLQNQTRVQVETASKLAVQLLMAAKRVEYVWSAILDYELSFNPSVKRRRTIHRWKSGACCFVDSDASVRRRANELQNVGLKPKDAAHLASAESAGCDWLLTTDDRFVKRANGNTTVRVASPVSFIMENRDEDV